MRRCLTFILVLALTVSSASAQSGDWAAVEGLSNSADISIKTKQGKKLQGDFDSANPERIVIWSQERAFPGRKIVRREIARNNVKEVRLNRRFVSAAAGAAIGVGVGVGVGAAVDSQYSSNEDRGLLGAVLGILGAAIGAGIGKTHPFIKGKLIYVAT